VVRLPSPPSTNNLYHNVPGKGRRRTERYATWATAAGWAINPFVSKLAAFDTFFHGQVEVLIITGNRLQDVDNGIKAILDLLTAMRVYADDKLVEKLTIERGGDKREAVVTVKAYTGG
jgi:Holliday junction resolvase RusA-like endonuclease